MFASEVSAQILKESQANSEKMKVSPMGYYTDVKELLKIINMEFNDNSLYLREVFSPLVGADSDDFNKVRAVQSQFNSLPYKIEKGSTFIGIVFLGTNSD
jgi:hypothetical protein